MPIAVEEHSYVICEIENDEAPSAFVGTLSYKGNKNGTLKGGSIEAVQSQFRMVCDLLDGSGGMLRRGTIMLGYHNNVLKGDVVLPDGEIIGFWEMEEGDDTSHFTPDGHERVLISAPSAWMLQDAIANWLEERIAQE